MPVKVDGTNGVLQAYDFQVFSTGFAYTFPAGTTSLIAAPAGTLATGTITMPLSPSDGMVVSIATTQEITALTLNGNTGQSIGGTQTTQMPANSAVSFVYRQANATWYRTSAPALGNVGTAPVYAARAWVNFNGQGTVAIRASGNVSSITDNGTGDYTVNFTTAMPDANYAFTVGFNNDNNAYPRVFGTYGNTPTANGIRLRMAYTLSFGTQVFEDLDRFCVAIFR